MKKSDYLWVVLCVAAFVCFLLQGVGISLQGDDLSYGAYINYYGGSLLYYPRWVLRHWIFNNGRAANYLAPLMLYFSPRWLLISLNAVMASLYLYFSGGCLSRSGAWAKAMVMSLLLLTMAWWDVSTIFDVSFNYVWASALGLGFVCLWIGTEHGWGERSRLTYLLACAFAFVAGQMHEAMSTPLCAGLVSYYMIGNRHKLIDRKVKAYVLCFFIGALLCFGSVGSWSRLAAEKVADDSVVMILLKSDFYALALLLTISVSAIFRRKRLEELFRSAWIVFAVASIVSMCFSAVGGIVGRSGWFAQTYALIALVWYYWPRGRSKALEVAVCAVSVLAIACWSVMTHVQLRLGEEGHRAARLYAQSDTGTFYMDHTSIDELPWYTLMRPRGAVTNSDDYSRLLYEREYRPSRPYAMLPAADETLPVDSLLCRAEYTLAPKAEYILLDNPYHGLWRDSAGKVWVEVKATHHGTILYYSEPLEIPPGYRLPQSF